MTSSVWEKSTPGVALDQRLERHGGQLVGAEVLERPLERPPDRRAHGVDDDGFWHMTVPFELDSPGGRTPRGSLPRRSHSTEGRPSYMNADVRSSAARGPLPLGRGARLTVPPVSGWPRDRHRPALMVGSGPWRQSWPMTATDARQQLQRLQVERLDAVDAGLGANELYMADLESDIAASRAAYVALAVTEIAAARAAPARGRRCSGALQALARPRPGACPAAPRAPRRRARSRGSATSTAPAGRRTAPRRDPGGPRR